MAYLILDLDDTSIITQGYPTTVNKNFHEISENSYPARCGDFNMNINIINPSKLAQLIETACFNHDGVIIITSGLWDASIRSTLANNLPLSDIAKSKLEQCLFHSPLTDKILFNLDTNLLMHLNKADRFEMIKKHYPYLASKNFVLLDDNENHINSFKDHNNVQPVLAETNKRDNYFYTQAINALKYVAAKETPVITKNYLKRKSNPEDEFQKNKKFKEIKVYDKSIYYHDQLMTSRIVLKEQEFKNERKAMRFFQKTNSTQNLYLTEEKQNSHTVLMENNPISYVGGKVLEGTYNFCLTCEEKPRLICSKTKHHSYLANGKRVLGVGTLLFDGGKLLEITNHSGHYKPSNNEMIDIIKVLYKLSDETLVSYKSFSEIGKGQYLVSELLEAENFDKLRPIDATQSIDLGTGKIEHFVLNQNYYCQSVDDTNNESLSLNENVLQSYLEIIRNV